MIGAASHRTRIATARWALALAIGLAPVLAAPASAQSSTDDPLAGAEALGWARGVADAPVTVVEVTDLSCPYCASFHAGTRQALIDEFVPAGQVRWITLTFVSGQYPNSDALGVAAECAGRQGGYERFLTEAYSGRDRWVNATDPTATAEARAFAGSIELDLDDFDACRSDPDVVERLRAITALASANGVRGTPTWFVNGFLVMGDLPHGYARQFITSQLPG